MKAKDVTETVKELIRTKASLRKVAMGLNMDRSQLVRSLRKGKRPRIDTIVKILDYLGYEIRIIKKKR